TRSAGALANYDGASNPLRPPSAIVRRKEEADSEKRSVRPDSDQVSAGQSYLASRSSFAKMVAAKETRQEAIEATSSIPVEYRFGLLRDRRGSDPAPPRRHPRTSCCASVKREAPADFRKPLSSPIH